MNVCEPQDHISMRTEREMSLVFAARASKYDL